MTAMYTPKSDNLVPQKSTDGSAPVAVAAPNTKDGYTLPVGTWYVELGASEGRISAETWLEAFCMSFNAALAATVTLESTNYPLTLEGSNMGVDVTAWQAAANRWFPESLPAAQVLSAGGAGNAYAAPTFTAGGANLGGFLGYIVNAGARRYRLKIVVTTQGTMRVGVCGKG